MLVQTSNFGESRAIRASLHCGVYDFREHIHQFPEIILVLEGELEIIVDGRVELARAGDVIVVQPFRLHGFRTPRFCRMWMIVFSNDFISDFSEENELLLYGERAVFTPSPEVLALLKHRMPYTLERLVLCDKAQYRRIKAALYAVYENYFSTASLTGSGESAYKTEILSRVIAYLREHYSESVSLVGVARALGYNPEYISHCLSALRGMNFRALVNCLRLDKAKNLLITSDRTVVDIALECGFSCERSFHRVFREMSGMTPGEYRRIRK
ncbi:MAG: helix-turn-helix domain-containing protein [Clostridia bacterium]|nr:helix-turn-helix domain-containing protein [Clostridia bacterium]